MIELDKTILTDDIAEQYFVCDLTKCKGACCVEGDLGAPLEEDELKVVDESLEQVRPYMSESGKKVLDEQGAYILDEDGEYSTTTIHGRECIFAFYDERGTLKCSFEKAWKEKKTSFRKPISCHLYPLRLKKYDQFTAVNYDRWDICSPACSHGQELKVPLYKFLKEPLIRKFGKEWYDKLVDIIKTERKSRHKSRSTHQKSKS